MIICGHIDSYGFLSKTIFPKSYNKMEVSNVINCKKHVITRTRWISC